MITADAAAAAFTLAALDLLATPGVAEAAGREDYGIFAGKQPPRGSTKQKCTSRGCGRARGAVARALPRGVRPSRSGARGEMQRGGAPSVARGGHPSQQQHTHRALEAPRVRHNCHARREAAARAIRARGPGHVVECHPR